ncbi:MAG: DNA repair protein RecO [Saprospiraceae bacterium]|nr:DNA repair protein RecO [Saprospiraceae bacterium]
MALFKSIGIVFRTVKYSETSLILEVFTREKGMRSFIVSGVRSAKARQKASLYQHLNILDFVAYDKDNALARIKECKIEHYYQRVTFDVVRSSIGLFILEVCKNSIKEQEANIELFDFIYRRLQLLDSDKDLNFGLFPIKFMLDMSKYIGFMPLNNFSESSPYFDLYNGRFISTSSEKYISELNSSRYIAMIDNTSLDALKAIMISKDMRNQILDDLIIYFRLHIDSFKELKTVSVLRSIF